MVYTSTTTVPAARRRAAAAGYGPAAPAGAATAAAPPAKTGQPAAAAASAPRSGAAASSSSSTGDGSGAGGAAQAAGVRFYAIVRCRRDDTLCGVYEGTWDSVRSLLPTGGLERGATYLRGFDSAAEAQAWYDAERPQQADRQQKSWQRDGRARERPSSGPSGASRSSRP